jgi:hypothetical protein
MPIERGADGSSVGPESSHIARARGTEASQAIDLPDAVTSEEEEVLHRIRNLPPELAVLLLSVGTLGFVLPGVIGTPALIAGGLALWPSAFGRAETWFARRYPSVHRKSLRQMGRFLADLERRYPQGPNARGG